MKNVIVTIDTEGHVGYDPITHLIWGVDRQGNRNGISLIMDICDKYHAKALFFVDFAEAWHYGEEKIAEVVHYIDSRGHDIGVHIHPDHMADPSRLFLHEYTYEEQFSIIQRCTELYTKLLKRPPLAFRAGKYGANRDTLRILSEFGYKADFSEFYGQKWCGIIPAVTCNVIKQIGDGLIEVPTMSYQSKFYGIIDRYDKLDTNMDWCEFKHVFSIFRELPDIGTIVFFAHSFSFIEWRRKPDTPRRKNSEIRKFERALQIVCADKDLSFIELSELLQNYKEVENDIVPRVTGIRAVFYFFLKAASVLKARFDIKFRKN